MTASGSWLQVINKKKRGGGEGGGLLHKERKIETKDYKEADWLIEEIADMI